MALRIWARHTAKRHLAGELPRRWAHTEGVARRAANVGAMFAPPERDVLEAAAWLHDIGYANKLAETGFHQLDGANFLVAHGVPRRVCALVAHHAGASAVADELGLSAELSAFEDEQSPVRDALWYCDMTTSPGGRPVGYADRMAELRARRGQDDPVVRALVVNGGARTAAVRRTERLLRDTFVPACGIRSDGATPATVRRTWRPARCRDPRCAGRGRRR
jgi:hypothetical protein